MTAPHRAGFVALLGKPNAGKSTLLNNILGEKLAAVSALPQTTRDRLFGIHSDTTCQIVFVDLPGVLEPTDRLNECLSENVRSGIKDVDLIVHLVDVGDPEPLTKPMMELLQAARCPVVLALNKLDGKRLRTDAGSWAGEKLPGDARERYTAILGLSAKEGHGIPDLLETIRGVLPEGPPFYDPETITDRDMRFLAQEMIREKAFLHLHEELPYAVAVEIREFQEREAGKWYIAADLHVERDSQKGIVIGKKGETLRRISSEARRDIERLCQAPVYLDLWVKVRPKWRKRDADLRRFGYTPPKRK